MLRVALKTYHPKTIRDEGYLVCITLETEAVVVQSYHFTNSFFNNSSSEPDPSSHMKRITSYWASCGVSSRLDNALRPHHTVLLNRR
ncbi:hypothetical protein TNIN_61361 [Trichonephila inaurata madagascariensis]|uniref:Uncharacterized protein n=1 Tax=Trichonephila inaurata madagascariensis TaxID=2747483 RepID=A0A8X6WWJ0_9ARAC|nr:hypothetical protein TNIN_61361 [Trichonephila inaurata madagascariensis]